MLKNILYLTFKAGTNFPCIQLWLGPIVPIVANLGQYCPRSLNSYSKVLSTFKLYLHLRSIFGDLSAIVMTNERNLDDRSLLRRCMGVNAWRFGFGYFIWRCRDVVETFLGCYRNQNGGWSVLHVTGAYAVTHGRWTSGYNLVHYCRRRRNHWHRDRRTVASSACDPGTRCP